MSYNIKVIKKEEYQESRWAGGTTTQLLIYPQNASYNDRNFKWRLSSATVELEESTFTSLPGISRIIMSIEGKLKLEHEGHYNTLLNEFEQDSFSGDWKTKSFGKVRDFNLMMNKECSGKLEYISINKEKSKQIKLYSDMDNDERFSQISEIIYPVNGNIEIFIEGEKININKEDLLLITKTDKEKIILLNINNKEENEVNIIKSTIYY